MSRILIGADPELFAYRGENYISVHDILPGTKSQPVKVPNGAIQVDGVAAEFNIDPADNEETFFVNVNSVKTFLSNFIGVNDSGITLLARPTAFFNKEYFDKLPDFAKELGCEPDYSAYTKAPNPKPSTTEPFRTGSGHVHIGWTDVPEEFLFNGHFIDCCELVKQLDATLLPMSYLWDADNTRRKLYGSKGSFRPKKYGVEYRVLSNAWVDQDWTTRYVFSLTKAVSEMFLNGVFASEELGRMGPEKDMESLVHNFEIIGLPLPPAEVVEAYSKVE